jgi:hypothetical protein
MGFLLVACGLVLAGVGTWSGYRNARAALLPFVGGSDPAGRGDPAGGGDPTRAAIDAARPVHARARVRRAVRSTAIAIAWLVLALYGLYLAQTGLILGGIA